MIGYIIVIIGLIIIFPSSYFTSMFHLPKLITYALMLIAPVLIIIASCLLLLSGYLLLGFGYLMLLMTYGLLLGVSIVIAGLGTIVEHFSCGEIDSDGAILISIALIGIIILVSVSILISQL